MSTLISFVPFQIGWFSCVLGTANHLPWLCALAGPLAYFGGRAWMPRRVRRQHDDGAVRDCRGLWAIGMPLLLWLSDRYDGIASAATDD